MTFYQNRADTRIWVVLISINIAMAAAKLHAHGLGSRFALLQLLSWSLFLVYWGWLASTRWSLQADALEQRRFGPGAVKVPYGEILSVDPTGSGKRSRQISVTYGTRMFADQVQRMVIATRRQPELLEELRRRAPQASFTV